MQSMNAAGFILACLIMFFGGWVLGQAYQATHCDLMETFRIDNKVYSCERIKS